MTDRPNLHIVKRTPWIVPLAYAPDVIEILRHRRPSTIDRIADALDSPFAVGVYVGTYIGMMATVLLAICWTVL